MPKKFVRESVGLYEAKTQLSSLVDRAAAGEEIVIMKSGQPMARLVPMESRAHLRVPGQGKDAWKVAADFDAPLPDELLDTFEGPA
ncbi:MAG: type II toxin-antitoxin system Phd/YefM family antitoxin [Gemmatimonas sp.]|jgi:prevent-host-death family protein|uniref:type II toxin-antitoxin system Phd/YefM family antitoxin n=1 Tax=Gemmatimonas sp. TaxID=1962908 RepID=UPI00391F136D|nr:type II toxin-antitoxin system prevent-host-death family antitoxin [Gemmatimonadota bacterium]